MRQAKFVVEHKLLVDKQESYQLRMAVVFQSVHEGGMVFDEEMKLPEINDAAVRLFFCNASLKGLSPKEISAYCPPLDILREIIEERCDGSIFRLASKTSAGHPLIFGLTMAPLTGHGGRELGTVLVLRDESMPNRQIIS